MKRAGIIWIFVLLLAAVAAAQYGTPQAPQAPAQTKPYTATFFGPWNEAVAKTHVPMVKTEIGGKGLKVNVQIDNHPMDPTKPHWIEWIRVEDMKGKKLAEKTFKATDPRPATAAFEISGSHDKLRVLEHCNIHGTWLAETEVPKK